MLAVDASAVVAIALGEPEQELFIRRLDEAESIFMAPANIAEAGLAIVLRQSHFGLDRFAKWLAELRIVEASVSGAGALEAYLRYGRGVHRAALNFGDCFAYALAKQLDAPLLYKGNEFALTDVRPALQPM